MEGRGRPSALPEEGDNRHDYLRALTVGRGGEGKKVCRLHLCMHECPLSGFLCKTSRLRIHVVVLSFTCSLLLDVIPLFVRKIVRIMTAFWFSGQT